MQRVEIFLIAAYYLAIQFGSLIKPARLMKRNCSLKFLLVVRPRHAEPDESALHIFTVFISLILRLANGALFKMLRGIFANQRCRLPSQTESGAASKTLKSMNQFLRSADLAFGVSPP